jgi:hypothetical protein
MASISMILVNKGLENKEANSAYQDLIILASEILKSNNTIQPDKFLSNTPSIPARCHCAGSLKGRYPARKLDILGAGKHPWRAAHTGTSNTFSVRQK